MYFCICGGFASPVLGQGGDWRGLRGLVGHPKPANERVREQVWTGPGVTRNWSTPSTMD